MKHHWPAPVCCAAVLLGLAAAAPLNATVQAPNTAKSSSATASDLSKASSEELMRDYQELRSLHAGEQWAAAENVTWKRDAGTFTFKDGRLTFAAPVAGHVVAAVFIGLGAFELDPPTAMDEHQIARFTKQPKLVDDFREAVFFFTDHSWEELGKLVHLQSGGGDSEAAGKLLEAAERKYQETFNEWWSNEAKDYPVLRNVAARMVADLSDPSSQGFFLADLKTEHYSDLLYQISWNRDSLLQPFFSSGEEVMLMQYKHDAPSEWLSGFHLAAEYARTPHPEHRRPLAHCREERIDAEISKDNHISATAQIEFEVRGGTPRVVPMNLQGVLRISSVTDEAGGKVAFIQEDRKLDSDPWVILPEPVAAGKVYKMKIAYEEDSTRDSRIIHQQGSGLYYVTARESWYPSFGAFDDRTHFRLHFTSPKKFKFVATGHLVSSEKNKDSLETEWESEIPYSVVGFNYGDFVEAHKSDTNLTVTAYTGREPPDVLKGIAAAMETGGFQPGQAGQLGQTNAEAQTGILVGGFNTAHMAGYAAAESYQAFKLFEAYFGELPFKSVSVTEQPVMGYAQSWPTLIFLPFDSLLDSTTRNSLRLSASAEAREFYNIVAVHEMSHQWWGHMVGWKTYHDQWLSEGFADFSAGLYLRTFEPKKVRSFWDLKRKWLLSNNGAGHRPVDVGPVWLNYQTNSYLEPRNSYFLIYYKGAYILEMLRLLMEDPRSQNPDAGFIAMMHDFVKTYTARNPSTEDFRQIVEKHLRQPMDWFFNEWVYGTETPRYDFGYELKDGPDGKPLLHLSLTQSEVSDNFEMKVPVYIYIDGTPRRLGFLGVKGHNTTTADVPLPVRPEKVTLDEYHSVLAIEK